MPKKVLRKLLFENRWDSKNRPVLVLSSGSVDDGHASELGLIWHESKDEEDPSYYWYHYPLNEHSVHMMSVVYPRLGYKPKVILRDTSGKDATDLLLPMRPKVLQKRYVSQYGGDVVQADDAVYQLSEDLIRRYHKHLASASMLLVLEDFEPEDMAGKFGRQGEVWGIASLVGGQFRKLTGFDFKITFCTSVWNVIKPNTKRWLADHEHMHCGRNIESGRWTTEDHDIQMFSAEVRRYPDVEELLRQQSAVVANKVLGDVEAEKKKRKKDKHNKGAFIHPLRSIWQQRDALARSIVSGNSHLCVVPHRIVEMLKR